MDVDMDMDIDLGDPNPPEEELQGYRDASNPNDEEQQPQPIIEEEPVPNKVHIRGLDELTTKDIINYATEHVPHHKPKVEWVDDTSANLVYEDASIASDALQAFSISSFNGIMPHDLQLRNARSMSAHPTVELQVRLATIKDKKPARAHERSRFYMMHPEHDPREQARDAPDYRRRRQPRRRRSIENNRFDASMYDDDARSSSSLSYASDDRRDSRHRYSRRSRDRSASPTRSRHNYRRRDRTPPRGPRAENKGKELFPAGTKTEVLTNNAKKELFPQRKAGNGVLHRRNDSIDATHDLTSDVLSSTLSKTMSVPFLDGAYDRSPIKSTLRSDSMRQESTGLRSDSMRQEANGFSIKGAAGFSIKGAANANTESRVKELFPTKANNRGKELFAGRSRRHAEEYY